MNLKIALSSLTCVLIGVGCSNETEEGDVARIENPVTQVCTTRDAGLLHSIKPTDGGAGRNCLYDDECPLGAFCNHTTSLCDWQCIPGESSYECGADQLCDCFGRCVPADSSGAVENRLVLPTINASPAYVMFGSLDGGQAWIPQDLNVSLEFASGVNLPLWIADGGAGVKIEGGPGMTVSCPLDDGGMSSFASECNVLFAGTDFLSTQNNFQARKTAKLVPFTTTDGGIWTASLFSPDTSPPRILITAEAQAGAASGALGVRELWGHILLGRTSEAADGGAVPVRLPIRAWANQDYLLLYDGTRTLSPTGKILLDAAAGTSNYVVQWLSSVDGQGALSVRIEADNVPNPTLTSSVTGSFKIGLPRPVAGASGQMEYLSAEYKLSRLRGGENLESCVAGSCASGYSCEPNLGVCVPGHLPSSSEAGSAQNTIVSGLSAIWDDNVARNMLNTKLAFPDTIAPWRLAEAIVCSQGNEGEADGFAMSRFMPSVTSGDEDNILAHSGDLQCDDGNPPYVADFFTQVDRYSTKSNTVSTDRLKTVELLDECLADLARRPIGERTDTAEHWLVDRFGQRYSTQRLVAPITNQPDPATPGRCFSLARFFGALSLSSLQANSRDQRLAVRLLQQWIGVNGFIAHQVAQEREAAEFLGEDLSARPEINRLDRALARFESAWDVLLDGTYSGVLPGNDETRTCVHLNPDYRRAHLPVASWKAASNGSIQTRGMGVRWRAGDSTIVYAAGAPTYSSCSSPSTVPLFEIDFGATGEPDGAATFAGECGQSTMKSSRYSAAPGGGTNWWWWTSTFRSFGLVTSAGSESSYTFNGLGAQPGAAPTPYASTLPFTHYLLRPSIGYAGGPVGSTLAAWDYALENSLLSSALAGPSFADGTTAAEGSHVFEGKQNDPAVGLPPIVLEGVAAHIRLLIAQLDKAEGEVIAQCGPPVPGSAREKIEALFGRTMRYVTTLEAFAIAARERELAACGSTDLAGDSRWRSASAELAVLRQRAYDKLEQISDCAPFGLALNQAPIFPVDQDFTNDVARFFSNSTRLHEIAQNQVDRAVADAKAAEQAWISARQAEVNELQSLDVKKQRVEELSRQYGSQVIQLCGLGPEYSSEGVLEEFLSNDMLSASNCYIKSEEPKCALGESALAELLEDLPPSVQAEDVRFTVCTWQKLRESEASIVLIDEINPDLVDDYASLSVGAPRLETTSAGAKWVVDLSSGTQSGTLRVAHLYSLPFRARVETALEPRSYGDMKSTVAGLLPPRAIADAYDHCAIELGGRRGMPQPELNEECFQGQIGEAWQSVVQAHKNIEIARSAWSEYQERFDIGNRLCQDLAETASLRQELVNNHSRAMKEMIRAKAAEDRAAAEINMVASAYSTLGLSLLGLTTTNSFSTAASIQREELSYQANLEAIQSESAVRQCLIQAKQHLVGVRTAALQIDSAVLERQRALTSFENMKTRVEQLVAEGFEVVDLAKNRSIPGFAHHFWLSERIETAKQSFERAKRFAYLFGRALEYEKQQSNVALGEILSARGPYALDRAFSQFAYSSINKTVWGHAPEGSPFALRLRDNILNLGNAVQAEGERNLTAAQQFTQRLVSSAGALYDDNGKYIGQGFQFALPDIPNTNECAERIWDVHVRLSGGSKLKAWTEMNGRPALRLRQRNTFASRLCTDTAQWQTAFVRPSWTAEDWPKPGDEMAFTETVVKAAAGTSFLDFETQGDGPFGATKLRGRGLYSEYEIVFPWEGLLSKNNRPTDFPLYDVIDIWIRFEPAYVVPGR